MLFRSLITIEDNGAGFDATEVERAGGRAGLGLIGIRERASQLRGTVRLESAAGRGTRLTVELPARACATVNESQTRKPGQPVGEPTPGLVFDG